MRHLNQGLRNRFDSLRISIPTIFLIIAGMVIMSNLTSGADMKTTGTVSTIVFPDAPKRPVSDVYFGTKVTEDYRWLEDGNDPGVKNWVDEENKLTRSILDAYPHRTEIALHLKELYDSESSSYNSLIKRGGVLFAIKNQPPKEQPLLVALPSPDDPAGERVIVDPNVLDPSGSIAIDFYVPSVDGRLVAVSLSKGGSEDGTIHIYETSTGKEIPDMIPHVNYPTAGGSVAWNADNSGLYYTRYPAPGDVKPEDVHFFQQVYFHKLGTPLTSDHYIIGKDFPRIAEIALTTSEDGQYILATVENGDGGEYAHFVKDPSDRWSQVTKFTDKITLARFGLNQSLYMLSHNNAPKGQILQLPLTATELPKASIVVPQGDESIEDFVPTVEKLYLVDMVGGPSHIRALDISGKAEKAIPAEEVSTAGDIIWTGGDEILFRQESNLQPPAWYRYDPSMNEAKKTALALTTKANFSGAEVMRVMATSKDGTKIPMNIIRPKGTKLDGQNPTRFYAYGGYGINERPGFSTFRSLWLQQGGIYVTANIRGGGEFGEDWHLAGNLTRKQNVFDDFAACAKYLIDSGYTNASKLAIEGGSNGGLLMGAELTQHPDLFHVVISYVGIYDMLRVELFPNGQFNTTEFGTVKDKDQFEALYAYSPYHHVKDGTAYPAVLFLTGENDGRVDPANSRKMAARLQAASSSGLPILLRQSSSSGHGIGTALSEEIEQNADVFAFLFTQFGMEYKAVK